MQNGHRRSADFSELAELSEVTIGARKILIPLDIPMTLQNKWRRLLGELEARQADISDEEIERIQNGLWEVGDEILKTAVPPVQETAREVLVTFPVLAQLLNFLSQGYRELQSSMGSSPSSTPSTAESPSAS